MPIFEEAMTDKIKAAVSQLQVPHKKSLGENLLNLAFGVIVCCFIAFGAGVAIAFGVIGYRLIMTW